MSVNCEIIYQKLQTPAFGMQLLNQWVSTPTWVEAIKVSGLLSQDLCTASNLAKFNRQHQQTILRGQERQYFNGTNVLEYGS